jgi:hypothetical protein
LVDLPDRGVAVHIHDIVVFQVHPLAGSICSLQSELTAPRSNDVKPTARPAPSHACIDGSRHSLEPHSHLLEEAGAI